jgi:hypothetical protein
MVGSNTHPLQTNFKYSHCTPQTAEAETSGANMQDTGVRPFALADKGRGPAPCAVPQLALEPG